MRPIIKIEKLFKEYRLGTIGYATLREDMQRFLAELRGRPDPNSIIGTDNVEKRTDRILAINNLSLEVNQGERLAIVGNNGSGKSTLLKIISRISAPTSGTIKLKGRIASLIALGTGFHSELSGRNNIYLNGTILGLRKKEIEKKINQIINFAGIDKFIDTPVKRYSSGMYVRLGFSIAAHLNPDILITDEVLAVADLEFRKKSLKRLKQISQKGKTIIFVSHNLNSVKELCDSGILLDNGKIIFKDKIDNVLAEYKNMNKNLFFTSDENLKFIYKDRIKFLNVDVIDSKNNFKNEFSLKEKIGISITFEVLKKVEDIYTEIEIFSSSKIHIFSSTDIDCSSFNTIGIFTRTVWIDQSTLNDGTYFVNINLLLSKSKIVEKILTIDAAADFKIVIPDNINGLNSPFQISRGGLIISSLNWTSGKLRKD